MCNANAHVSGFQYKMLFSFYRCVLGSWVDARTIVDKRSLFTVNTGAADELKAITQCSSTKQWRLVIKNLSRALL